MSEDDERNYKESNTCCFCKNKFFGDDKNRKVRNHDHLTGKYRGAAHSYCNLRARLEPYKTIIPVFFHNLRGYDSHLIMQVISGMKEKLQCIANNMESTFLFSIGRQIRFLDSLQFLNAPLDKLVKSNDSFPITRKYEPDPNKVELLLKKGNYPYEYMDNFDHFKEMQLLRKESFYSSLNDENIMDEEYQHVLKVW